MVLYCFLYWLYQGIVNVFEFSFLKKNDKNLVVRVIYQIYLGILYFYLLNLKVLVKSHSTPTTFQVGTHPNGHFHPRDFPTLNTIFLKCLPAAPHITLWDHIEQTESFFLKVVQILNSLCWRPPHATNFLWVKTSGVLLNWIKKKKTQNKKTKLQIVVNIDFSGGNTPTWHHDQFQIARVKSLSSKWESETYNFPLLRSVWANSSTPIPTFSLY